MKKATSLEEIQKNFNPFPLTGDELDTNTGFYVDTIEARTNDEFNSPLRDLYDACTGGSAQFIQVLMGHRGCGKSTEINKLQKKLEGDGYIVKKIDCQSDTNLFNISVSDILFLIMNALLEVADENSIPIPESNLKILNSFFDEKETISQITTSDSTETNADLGINLTAIVKIALGLKKQIINKEGSITTIRHKITNNFSDWKFCLNSVIDRIYFKLQRRPIIVFENFDKIVPVETALKIFDSGYISSEQIRTYCIFTFPISLTYAYEIGKIEYCFKKHIFPMIETETKNGEKNEKGYQAIKNIIEKRADLNLFDTQALDLLIKKTGGSLRDVFSCILFAASRADFRASKLSNVKKVEYEDVEKSLLSLKSDLTRRIVTGDYPALKKIHSEKTEIDDIKKMLKFLEAHVVLEYNGERWYDCHPLIWEFIAEKV